MVWYALIWTDSFSQTECLIKICRKLDAPPRVNSGYTIRHPYHACATSSNCYITKMMQNLWHITIFQKKHKWLYSFWPALVSQAVYIYSYLAMCNDLFFKYHPHRIEKHSKLNRQIKSHAVINSEGRIEWHRYIIYWYSIATSYIGWVSTSSQHDSVDPAYTDSNYDFGIVLLSLYMTTMFNNDFITYRWRC